MRGKRGENLLIDRMRADVCVRAHIPRKRKKLPLLPPDGNGRRGGWSRTLPGDKGPAWGQTREIGQNWSFGI